MNCKDQLSDAKGEILALNQKIEDMNEPIASQQQETLSSLITKTPPIRANTMHNPPPPPIPVISSSMPTSSFSENDPSAIHHHFHYYRKNSKGEYIQITDEMDSQSNEEVITFYLYSLHPYIYLYKGKADHTFISY